VLPGVELRPPRDPLAPATVTCSGCGETIYEDPKAQAARCGYWSDASVTSTRTASTSPSMGGSGSAGRRGVRGVSELRAQRGHCSYRGVDSA
jgi:hypothetical protein